jgi:hypothetical protein
MKTLTPALCLVLASGAQAIVIRHDRDDARYRALAQSYKAPVCTVAGDGHGTLVAPTWVVTAAHVAQDIGAFNRFVTFGNRHVPVRRVFLHPDWRTTRQGPRPDIALIELAHPVRGITPVALYDRQDEVGKTIVFVGTGQTGDGNTGPTKSDDVWRAAENVVEEAIPEMIRFRFEAPPAGSELEGISGPGDSGGPALLRERGRTYILGVSSGNSAPRGGGHCTYGSDEYYGRVSTNLPWLRQTMKDRLNPFEPWGRPQSLTTGWPTAPLGTAAKAYIDLFNTGDPDQVESGFSNRFRVAKALTVTAADARKKRTTELIATYGPLEPRATAEAKDGGVSVLAYSRKARTWLMLALIPGRDEPTKVDGIRFRQLPTAPAGFKP